ncbi:MAG: alpha/beta hydrolase [Candidatus Binatia bacterium]
MRRSPAQDYRWIESGAGHPVVLLNGIFGILEDWDAMLRSVDPQWRFLVPEIPLFAATVREASIAEIGRHVWRFVDAMQLGSVVLGGSSIGGQVAIELALQDPDRVQGLILTGASGIGEHRIGTISHRPSTAYVRTQVANVLDRPELVSEERIESIRRTLGTPAAILKALRFSRECRTGAIASRLGDIRVPTLLVWGANDRITPRDLAERFQGALADAELVIIPDAGHAPMLEQPAAFAAATSSWLRRIGYGARIADARSA